VLKIVTRFAVSNTALSTRPSTNPLPLTTRHSGQVWPTTRQTASRHTATR